MLGQTMQISVTVAVLAAVLACGDSRGEGSACRDDGDCSGSLLCVDKTCMDEPLVRYSREQHRKAVARHAAAKQAAARGGGGLLGRWQIVHTIYSTNGDAGPPSEPLAPTTWDFRTDGTVRIDGGVQATLQYVHAGDQLTMTGMGPVPQEFEVLALTDDELVVIARISAGATRIANTTRLRRID